MMNTHATEQPTSKKTQTLSESRLKPFLTDTYVNPITVESVSRRRENTHICLSVVRWNPRIPNHDKRVRQKKRCSKTGRERKLEVRESSL